MQAPAPAGACRRTLAKTTSSLVSPVRGEDVSGVSGSNAESLLRRARQQPFFIWEDFVMTQWWTFHWRRGAKRPRMSPYFHLSGQVAAV